MKMIISNKSSVPIYEQIKNSIINQIINGELESEDKIPSIRALANDIKISIMTIKKAYDELEREGYITQIQGKGTFVAQKNENLIKEKAQKDIESRLLEVVSLAKKHNIDIEEIIDLMTLLYRS